MRYGRQRWRLRGRVEVSNKQIWDSEEYIFLPLVTELLSIKVSGVPAWMELDGMREKAVGFNRSHPLVLLVFGAPGSAGNI